MLIAALFYAFSSCCIKRFSVYENPVSRVAIFGFMNPVMGVLLSAWFLGENKEAFSVTGVLSLLFVAAGIMIVNIDPKKADQSDQAKKAGSV